MAINEDIYGDSTQWEDYWHDSCKMTSYSLWSKVRSGDWELNEPIDNSVCYCGAIGNFYAANPIAFFKTNNERVLMYPETNVHNMLFMLNRANKAGWSFDAGAVRGTNDKWSEWNNIYDCPEYCNQYSSQVLFNFKLNNLLFIPYVDVSTSNGIDAGSDNYTLGDWIKNHSTDHPYLHRVYLKTYYNTGTLESPAWASAQVHADHYIWLNKNAEFSHDYYDRGDRNVLSSYSIGARADMRQHLVIMGLGKTAGKDSITDAIPFTSSPIGYDSDLTHYIYDDNDNPSYVRYLREYSEDLVKEIYSQIAFLGVFFLGEGDGSFDNISLTSDRVYLGTIEEGGYTYGKYTHGEENADQPQYTWEDTSESDYDPNATPPMPNNWVDFPSGAYNTYTNLALGHWYHTASTVAINNLMEKVNEVDLENYDKSNTFGMNPIDGILEIKCIFFTPDRYTWDTQSTTQNVSIGLLQLQLDYDITHFEGYKPTNFEIGPEGCKGIFGDFRDLEPYTWASFSDAFCGSVDVAPSKIIDKWLRVIQTVDPITGDKISTLYASTDKEKLGQRIATVTGNCAMDLPINGLKVSDFQRNQYLLSRQISQDKIEAGAQLLNAAAGATISGVSKNPAGAGLQAVGGILRFAENIAGINTKEHVLNNTVPSPAKIQNGTSNCEYGCVFNPRITLGLTNTSSHYSRESYGELSGFAGYKVATPQSCGTGVHVFSHPKVYISGTRQEEYMLIDQLQKGIYVKEEPEPEI